MVNHLKPGTNQDQIESSRWSYLKRWADRIKAGKEVIGACAAIGLGVMLGTRSLVRQAVRAELEEMRHTSEEARVAASGVPQLRKEFDDHIREQAKFEASLRERVLVLGGKDLELKGEIADGFRAVQERIDQYLLRSERR
jgi:hypothetical protein